MSRRSSGAAQPAAPQTVLVADSAAEVLDQGRYLEAVGRSDRATSEDLDAARIPVEAERQALGSRGGVFAAGPGTAA